MSKQLQTPRKLLSAVIALLMICSILAVPCSATTKLKMPKSITSKKCGKLYNISVNGSTLNIKYCGPKSTEKKEGKYSPTNPFNIFDFSFIDYNKTEWSSVYPDLFYDDARIFAISPLRIENSINKVNITYPQNYQDIASYETATYKFTDPSKDEYGNIKICYSGTKTTKTSPGFKDDRSVSYDYIKGEIHFDSKGNIHMMAEETDYGNGPETQVIIFENNKSYSLWVEDKLAKVDMSKIDMSKAEEIDENYTIDSQGRWNSYTFFKDDPDFGECKLMFGLNDDGQIVKLYYHNPYYNADSDTITYIY